MASNRCVPSDGRRGACPRGATTDGLTIVAPRGQAPRRR